MEMNSAMIEWRQLLEQSRANNSKIALDVEAQKLLPSENHKGAEAEVLCLPEEGEIVVKNFKPVEEVEMMFAPVGSLQEQIKKIPDKLAFKIGDVADIIGVKQYVLRFWESEFDQIKPKKSKSGQRMYSKKDVEVLLLIKKLLHEDRFSIEGAKTALSRLKKQVKHTVHTQTFVDEYEVVEPSAVTTASTAKVAAPSVEPKTAVVEVPVEQKTVVSVAPVISEREIESIKAQAIFDEHHKTTEKLNFLLEEIRAARRRIFDTKSGF